MLVLSNLRLLEDLACSHRLGGLPSSSGSASLFHLRALAPQKRVVSSWLGTVEPQPPPEQALGLSSIVSLSHTRKPSSRSIDHSQASYTGAHTRRRTTILPLQNNSLRPVKVRSSEELTEPSIASAYYTRFSASSTGNYAR